MKRTLESAYDGDDVRPEEPEAQRTRPEGPEVAADDLWAAANSDVRRLVFDALPAVGQLAIALTSRANLAEARTFNPDLWDEAEAVADPSDGDTRWVSAYREFLAVPEYRRIARRVAGAHGYNDVAARSAAQRGDIQQLLCWDRMGRKVAWGHVVEDLIRCGHHEALATFHACTGYGLDRHVHPSTAVTLAIKSANVETLHYVMRFVHVQYLDHLRTVLCGTSTAIYDAYVSYLRTPPTPADFASCINLEVDDTPDRLFVPMLRHAVPPGDHEVAARALDIGVWTMRWPLIEYALESLASRNDATIANTIAMKHRNKFKLFRYRGNRRCLVCESKMHAPQLLRLWALRRVAEMCVLARSLADQ